MTVIENHPQFTISSAETEVLLDWKSTSGLSATDFAEGIAKFATHCTIAKPARAVIDARKLDQSSEAVSWLRAQRAVDGLDSYESWWAAEIVPLYNRAEIASLTVATGDPNAPGEIPAPEGAGFAIGYFGDLDTARTWTPG